MRHLRHKKYYCSHTDTSTPRHQMEQLIDINYLGVNIQAGHTAGSKHHATYTNAINSK